MVLTVEVAIMFKSLKSFLCLYSNRTKNRMTNQTFSLPVSAKRIKLSLIVLEDKR